MKGELRKPASVNAILLIGIFTFVFLGAEYLFVNMISLSVTEGRTVIAQNYALGASAVGFFLYPAMERWGGRRYKSALTFIPVSCTHLHSITPGTLYAKTHAWIADGNIHIECENITRITVTTPPQVDSLAY